MRLTLISLIVRRDLQSPLRHFKETEITHLYRLASYNDMTEEDKQAETLVQYNGFWDLVDKIKQSRPDVVQGIEPLTFPAGFKEYWAILYCRWRYGIPYFFPMLENRPVHKKFGPILGVILSGYLKLYARFADKIIILNRGAEQTLHQCKIPAHKIERLMWGCWGIDTDEFAPALEQDKANDLLFVGRLDYAKGIMDVLSALILLKEQGLTPSLIVIGQGPLEEAIRKYIRQNQLESQVTLQGVVKNKEIAAYFQKSKLTVVPAITVKRWEEQVGMVNLQSLSCATPVVSTLSGAIPEYVPQGEVGLLVPEKDPTQLAEAIRELLINPQKREQMGQKGRAHVLQHYHEQTNVLLSEKIIQTWFPIKNHTGETCAS